MIHGFLVGCGFLLAFWLFCSETGNLFLWALIKMAFWLTMMAIVIGGIALMSH